MSRLVASMEGFSIHWIAPSGAPALKAASLKIRAASALQFWAEGWNANMIGFLFSWQ
jgi:hypothetical protein